MFASASAIADENAARTGSVDVVTVGLTTTLLQNVYSPGEEKRTFSVSCAGTREGSAGLSGKCGATFSERLPKESQRALTRVLKMSSVDPDLAGPDSSIEGGVLYRHDW